MGGRVELPEDQQEFKLNEVCKLANVQPYMLRFWGSEFPQLEASRSGTGQRLYSREQVGLILEIRHLLFEEGLTIAGARKRIAGGAPERPRSRSKKAPAPGPKAVPASEPAGEDEAPDAPPAPELDLAEVDKRARERVQPLLATLRHVREDVAKIVADLKAKTDVGT